MLALDAHAVRSDPDEGVEPEEGDRELRDDLRERIDALDVRHLVDEHISTPIIGPAVGIVGQEHDRIDDSPRSRHIEPTAPQERHWPCDAEADRDALRQRKPSSIVDALAASRQSRYGNGTGDEPAEDGEGAKQPEDGGGTQPPRRGLVSQRPQRADETEARLLPNDEIVAGGDREPAPAVRAANRPRRDDRAANTDAPPDSRR